MYIYIYIIYIYIILFHILYVVYYSADAFFSLFTNSTNLHINKYKVKSATLQKFLMRNVHNK